MKLLEILAWLGFGIGVGIVITAAIFKVLISLAEQGALL